MSLPFALPENCKIVTMSAPSLANAVSSDYINCKNAHKVWFVIEQGGASDTNLVLTLTEATDVAAGTNTTVTAVVPIWANVNTGTNDTLVKQASAAGYTIDTTTTGNQLVVIEWDPVKHTSGYDCIAVTNTGGDGSNYASIVAYIYTRYPQATPPSAIID